MRFWLLGFAVRAVVFGTLAVTEFLASVRCHAGSSLVPALQQWKWRPCAGALGQGPSTRASKNYENHMKKPWSSLDIHGNQGGVPGSCSNVPAHELWKFVKTMKSHENLWTSLEILAACQGQCAGLHKGNCVESVSQIMFFLGKLLLLLASATWPLPADSLLRNLESNPSESLIS